MTEEEVERFIAKYPALTDGQKITLRNFKNKTDMSNEEVTNAERLPEELTHQDDGSGKMPETLNAGGSELPIEESHDELPVEDEHPFGDPDDVVDLDDVHPDEEPIDAADDRTFGEKAVDISFGDYGRVVYNFEHGEVGMTKLCFAGVLNSLDIRRTDDATSAKQKALCDEAVKKVLEAHSWVVNALK